MSALASFNYSNTSIIMLFLFPIVLPMPALMLWLEVKAFRRSEAQSIRTIVAMLMMIGIACLYLYPFHFPRLSRPVGFFQIWYLLLWLAVVLAPITLVWEAYKYGVFAEWMAKQKKARKKKLKRVLQ
jgi:cytochrome bd-type quinol oxidase subunit 2